MTQPNEKYSPIQVQIDDSSNYFSGNYIFNENEYFFEIYGAELNLNSIPADFVDTPYLTKKSGDGWQIGIKPEEGGVFIPLHTEVTDKVVEFILEKHEFFGRIHYPHHSHAHR